VGIPVVTRDSEIPELMSVHSPIVKSDQSEQYSRI